VTDATKFLMACSVLMMGHCAFAQSSGADAYISCTKDQRYVYDSSENNDNRAIVFDRATHLADVQDKSTTDAIHATEFGGVYEDCGNKHFFCLSGPLEIAIPKNISLANWQYHGLTCKSVATQKTGIYQVTCREAVRGNVFVVTYSVRRGILSFQHSPLGGDSLFTLRGASGLFSPCLQ
jgi:hypothetical protein